MLTPKDSTNILMKLQEPELSSAVFDIFFPFGLPQWHEGNFSKTLKNLSGLNHAQD